MRTDDHDYEIQRFRLRVRRDYAHRDEDQQSVNQQRLRVRVSKDFIMGNADVYPSEQPVGEAEDAS